MTARQVIYTSHPYLSPMLAGALLLRQRGAESSCVWKPARAGMCLARDGTGGASTTPCKVGRLEVKAVTPAKAAKQTLLDPPVKMVREDPERRVLATFAFVSCFRGKQLTKVKVAKSAAMTLPRMSIAKKIAVKKCNPNKGVKQTATPQATPRAIFCELSGKRCKRCTI